MKGGAHRERRSRECPLGELAPWWVAIATGAVAALAAAVGKVWSDQRAEIRQLRDDLAQANARAAELQRTEHGEHVKDLRRMAGLSTSLPPAAWPPPVIRKR